MIEIDERQWPLVVFTFSGRVTAGEHDDYFARHEHLLAAEKPYVGLVLVHDLMPWEGAAIRREVVWMRENKHRVRRLCRGMALVLPSLWLKGLLRAVVWLEPIPHPHIVCATVEEAMVWLGERLRALDANVTAEPMGR